MTYYRRLASGLSRLTNEGARIVEPFLPAQVLTRRRFRCCYATGEEAFEQLLRCLTVIGPSFCNSYSQSKILSRRRVSQLPLEKINHCFGDLSSAPMSQDPVGRGWTQRDRAGAQRHSGVARNDFQP